MSDAFTVPVEGAILSGEQRGERPTHVFVHGMGGQRDDWDRLIAALPSDISFLRYDLRGFGRSDARERASFSHADDLLTLLDQREIDRIGLVGLSMGGGIVLNFALSYPSRVSQLVLISPAMVGWEWSDHWKALWREVADAARHGDMALARERWWLHPMFAKVRESGAGEDLRRSLEAYHGRQWIRDDQRRELPDIERLHTLAMPTLLFTGEHDVDDIQLIASVIEGAAPHVTRLHFRDAGHLLTLERPGELAEAIVGFGER